MKNIALLSIIFFATNTLFYAKFPEKSEQFLLNKIDQILQSRAFSLNSNFDNHRLENSIVCNVDEDSEIFEDTVNEALRSFGVSHLYLTTHQEILNSLLATRQVNMNWEITPDGLLITTIDSGNESSIQPGDLILKQSIYADRYVIDDKNQFIWDVDLKRDGKTIKNVLLRFQNNSSMDHPFPCLSWIDNKVALLQIPSFGDDYPMNLVEDLIGKARKAKLVILNLQNNLGGSRQNLLHFANLILPSRFFIGATINKQGYAALVDQGEALESIVRRVSDTNRLMTSNDLHLGYGPCLLVLINGQTASSAEIIVQALKEAYGPTRCKVAGIRSAGEVLEGRLTPLDDEYCLYYPVADYITGKGYRIQGKGIVPDISLVVKSDLNEAKNERLLTVVRDLKLWYERSAPKVGSNLAPKN